MQKCIAGISICFKIKGEPSVRGKFMKEKTMLARKEARIHGTTQFPLAFYRVDSRCLCKGESLLVKHHWHEETEIMYLEQGRFQVEINMERNEIIGPCFCFLNQEELHYLESSGEFLESAVVFSPGMLLFAAEDGAQKRYLVPLCEGTLMLPRFLREGEPGYREVREAYLRIAGCGQEMEAFSQMRMKGALLEILAVLAEKRLFREEPLVLDRRVETIKGVLSYMKEHYREKIYVRQLAEKASMNEQYFCRFFKSVTGKSPMAYLNDLRIREAAVLLQTSRLSVTEICLETGFHNLGNFMRIFRERYGCTPLAYRKKDFSAANFR